MSQRLPSIDEDSMTRQVSEDLQNSEARFRAMYENAAVGIGIMGLDRRIIDANPALCRMLGVSLDEIIGQTPVVVTYPEDYPQSTRDFRELIAGDKDYYWSERRYVRKNGETFWAQVTMNIVRDPHGNPLYLVGMVIDIDDLKRAMMELRESEERFQATFESSAIGMSLLGLDGKILKVNAALCRISGYTEAELLERYDDEIVYSEDREVGSDLFFELLVGERDSYSMEKRYVRRNGQVFWARLTLSAVRNTDDTAAYLVGMIEDIDDQKRAAERLAAREADYLRKLEQRVDERTRELLQANKRLQAEIAQRLKIEKTLAEKAALEAVVSERTRLARDLHDAVTQTLFSASLIAEVLPDLWEIDREAGLRRLEELRQLTRGALAEMRTLLVELRPNALVEIPLPDLLRQLCESLIGRARLPIEFTVEGAGKPPPDVQVGLYRITQEALNNIVKHAKATRAVVSLRLGDQICLEVMDDGSGFDLAEISPDHLGLKIMLERAEAIGAGVVIDSLPGKGTRICVTWQNSNEQESRK